MPRARPRLAIVGASVRAAAYSALRGGFDAVAADLFADADLAAVCPAMRICGYPDALANWLAETDCDAWLYTGALENHPELVDRMAAIRPLLGTGGAALRQVRDPRWLQQAAAGAGAAFPETRDAADGLPRDGSWLCKTYRSAGGADVWRLDGLDALERAARQQAMFQQFVAGDAAAAVFVVAEHGARLLGLTRQLVGDGGDHAWRYEGSTGPVEPSTGVLRDLERIGKLLLDSGVRGVAGADLVLAGERAWLIEVNPRFTASVEILERACGVSAVAAHVAAGDAALAWHPVDAALKSTAAVRSTESMHAKRIVFAARPTTVAADFHHWAMENSSLDASRCWLADIPAAGEEIPAGRPVLTALAAGESVAAVEQNLRARVEEVQRRVYGE